MSARVVVIIQARMGSTRLPGKVLLDVDGRPMIDHVVERARRIASVDEVVVATSDLASDDVLADHVRAALKAPVFRGSESDVLARYASAAAESGADVVVRVTSDCPLLCPEVSDRVVRRLLDAEPPLDYVNNTLEPSYPRGLDTEAFWRDALDRAHREATSPHDREHVTPYLYLNRDRFRVGVVRDARDFSSLRWTVDTPEDLAMVRALLGVARGGTMADYESLLEAALAHPEIVATNAAIVQKTLGA